MKSIEEEIKKLDNRITNCYIFLPEETNDEYYVKIYYNWKSKNDSEIHTTGKKEFFGIDIFVILNNIKLYLNKEHEGYEIV